ncbi:MAG: aspartyl protease family protein [Nitrososphaerales archaeon]
MLTGFRAEPFKIDYTRDFIGGMEYFRPRVSVRLQNGQNSFRTSMLVDSGADISLIPLDVAEVLQLELSEDTKNNIGPSGKFEVKKSDVELWIAIGRKELCLGRIPVTVPLKRLVKKIFSLINYPQCVEPFAGGVPSGAISPNCYISLNRNLHT